MGYYVTYEGTITISDDRKDKVFEALKSLNFRHDLKTGGRFPAQGDPFEDKWFSWMPSRYHEEVESTDEILELLGFEVRKIDDEGTRTVYYDDKVGAEEHFLRTIVENGGQVNLDCRGEDGELWKYVVRNGSFEIVEPRIIWE